MYNQIMKNIPTSLRRWFLLHFVIDIIFAVPLMIAPAWTLGLLHFTSVETLTARLVAAALMGIGTTSLLMHKGGIESFNTMLNLKIIWSIAAMTGILWTISEGTLPQTGWIILWIFGVFFIAWIHFKISLKKL